MAKLNFLEAIRVLATNEIVIHRGIKYVRDIFQSVYALTYCSDLDRAVSCIEAWTKQERQARKEGDHERKIEKGELWKAILLDEQEVSAAYDALSSAENKVDVWFHKGLEGAEPKEYLRKSSGLWEEQDFLSEALPRQVNGLRLKNMGFSDAKSAKTRKWNFLFLKSAIENTELASEDRLSVWHLWLLVCLRESCKELAYEQMEEQIGRRETMINSGVRSSLSGIDAENVLARKLKWVPFNLGGYAAVGNYIEGEFCEPRKWGKEILQDLSDVYLLRNSIVRKIEPDTSPYILRAGLLNCFFLLGQGAFREEFKKVLLRFEGVSNPLIYLRFGISRQEQETARKMLAWQTDTKRRKEAGKKREEWLEYFEKYVGDPYDRRFYDLALQVDATRFGTFLPIEIEATRAKDMNGRVTHTLRTIKRNAFKGDLFDLVHGIDITVDLWTFIRACCITSAIRGGSIKKIKHVGQEEQDEERRKIKEEDFQRLLGETRDEFYVLMREANRDRLVQRNPDFKKEINTLFEEEYGE